VGHQWRSKIACLPNAFGRQGLEQIADEGAHGWWERNSEGVGAGHSGRNWSNQPKTVILTGITCRYLRFRQEAVISCLIFPRARTRRRIASPSG
jgi:hypothetical protein